jgi:hypothetical protein
MTSAPPPFSKTAIANSFSSASRKQMSIRCEPRSKICGPMRRADGRTNGPRSRGNIWKQETRSLRPTMGGSRATARHDPSEAIWIGKSVVCAAPPPLGLRVLNDRNVARGAPPT